MKIRIPQLLWYDNSEMELDFPPSWSISFRPMKGGGRRKLIHQEIEKSFQKPISSKPIRELAKGKREVVILFDDLARPTPVFEVLPWVLRELEGAGISDQQIRLIAALGAHGALTANDFRKKLGEEVLDRFPVYNHCPFLNCKEIGKTSYGTKVEVNSEVMNCDLKIAIGQVVPHPIFGLSGGSKIIMPGVSSYQSVRAHHGRAPAARQQGGRTRTDPGHRPGDLGRRPPAGRPAGEPAP